MGNTGTTNSGGQSLEEHDELVALDEFLNAQPTLPAAQYADAISRSDDRYKDLKGPSLTILKGLTQSDGQVNTVALLTSLAEAGKTVSTQVTPDEKQAADNLLRHFGVNDPTGQNALGIARVAGMLGNGFDKSENDPTTNGFVNGTKKVASKGWGVVKDTASEVNDFFADTMGLGKGGTAAALGVAGLFGIGMVDSKPMKAALFLALIVGVVKYYNNAPDISNSWFGGPASPVSTSSRGRPSSMAGQNGYFALQASGTPSSSPGYDQGQRLPQGPDNTVPPVQNAPYENQPVVTFQPPAMALQ